MPAWPSSWPGQGVAVEGCLFDKSVSVGIGAGACNDFAEVVCELRSLLQLAAKMFRTASQLSGGQTVSTSPSRRNHREGFF